ncbi:hypothetical protein SK128_000809 [Halocaridina rubra]|uniref:Uncharacterized protein n=1 Tax=Halocaridina rubra TaxID=373956 RepID=A0AAN9A2T2_HALRR
MKRNSDDKNNMNGPKDDFVPYTYIIEYTHTFSDDAEAAASKDNSVIYKVHPRLESEDIHKKVEIFTEEGYDKGSYDHRGYDKVKKGWNDFLQYDHMRYGSSSSNSNKDKPISQESQTGETKNREVFSHHMQGQFDVSNIGNRINPKKHFSQNSNSREPKRKTQYRKNQRSNTQRNTRLGQRQGLPNINFEPRPYSSFPKDSSPSFPSPFQFNLPPELKEIISQRPFHGYIKTKEKDMVASMSGEFDTFTRPLDSLSPGHPLHHSKILDIETNFNSRDPKEPVYTIITREGIGIEINNGLAPHSSQRNKKIYRAPSSTILVNSDNKSPYTNHASSFPYKTRTSNYQKPTVTRMPKLNKGKDSLYTRQPCLSRHQVTAYFDLDGWRPKRGPPDWYEDSSHFLGPSKGQVDVLREEIFAPVLKHALSLNTQLSVYKTSE